MRDWPRRRESRRRVWLKGEEVVSWEKERVSDKEEGPMPSETMKIRLRLLGGREGDEEGVGEGEGRRSCDWCCRRTARMMMAIVARKAQMKARVSRRRRH